MTKSFLQTAVAALMLVLQVTSPVLATDQATMSPKTMRINDKTREVLTLAATTRKVFNTLLENVESEFKKSLHAQINVDKLGTALLSHASDIFSFTTKAHKQLQSASSIASPELITSVQERVALISQFGRLVDILGRTLIIYQRTSDEVKAHSALGNGFTSQIQELSKRLAYLRNILHAWATSPAGAIDLIIEHKHAFNDLAQLVVKYFVVNNNATEIDTFKLFNMMEADRASWYNTAKCAIEQIILPPSQARKESLTVIQPATLNKHHAQFLLNCLAHDLQEIVELLTVSRRKNARPLAALDAILQERAQEIRQDMQAIEQEEAGILTKDVKDMIATGYALADYIELYGKALECRTTITAQLHGLFKTICKEEQNLKKSIAKFQGKTLDPMFSENLRLEITKEHNALVTTNTKKFESLKTQLNDYDAFIATFKTLRYELPRVHNQSAQFEQMITNVESKMHLLKPIFNNAPMIHRAYLTNNLQHDSNFELHAVELKLECVNNNVYL